MELQSPGLLTDLIFTRFRGTFTDRGDYAVLQTPHNPDFHWGNFLLFAAPPQPESFVRWMDLFEREFADIPGINHRSFTWQGGVAGTGSTQPFIEAGFDLEEDVVLTAADLAPPAYHNPSLQITRMTTEGDWSATLDLQVRTGEEKYGLDAYRRFKEAQMTDYRAMSEQGMGHWFGAWLDGQLVGSLGVYRSGHLARYQQVVTAPECRRQGVCQTLVYETGRQMLSEPGVGQLVMVADPGYHAARIYESLGFSPVETRWSLAWWQGKPVEERANRVIV